MSQQLLKKASQFKCVPNQEHFIQENKHTEQQPGILDLYVEGSNSQLIQSIIDNSNDNMSQCSKLSKKSIKESKQIIKDSLKKRPQKITKSTTTVSNISNLDNIEEEQQEDSNLEIIEKKIKCYDDDQIMEMLYEKEIEYKNNMEEEKLQCMPESSQESLSVFEKIQMKEQQKQQQFKFFNQAKGGDTSTWKKYYNNKPSYVQPFKNNDTVSFQQKKQQESQFDDQIQQEKCNVNELGFQQLIAVARTYENFDTFALDQFEKFAEFYKRINAHLYKKVQPNLANKQVIALMITFPWPMTENGFHWLFNQWDNWLQRRTRIQTTQRWLFNQDIVSWCAFAEEGQNASNPNYPFHAHMLVMFNNYNYFKVLMGNTKQAQHYTIHQFWKHLLTQLQKTDMSGDIIFPDSNKPHNINCQGKSQVMNALEYILKSLIRKESIQLPCKIRIAHQQYGCAEMLSQAITETDTQILQVVHKQTSNALAKALDVCKEIITFQERQDGAIKDTTYDLSTLPPKFNLGDPTCEELLKTLPKKVIIYWIQKTNLVFYLKNSGNLLKYINEVNKELRCSARQVLEQYVFSHDQWAVTYTSGGKTYQGFVDKLKRCYDPVNKASIYQLIKRGHKNLYNFFNYCLQNIFYDPSLKNSMLKGGFYFLQGPSSCGKTFWIRSLLLNFLPGIQYDKANNFWPHVNTQGEPIRSDNIYYIFKDEVNTEQNTPDFHPEKIKDMSSNNNLLINIKYGGVQMNQKLGQFYLTNYEHLDFFKGPTGEYKPGIKTRLYTDNMYKAEEDEKIFSFSMKYLENVDHIKLQKYIWSYVYHEIYSPIWEQQEQIEKEKHSEDIYFEDD